MSSSPSPASADASSPAASDPEFRIYNTQTHEVEPIEPVEEGHLKFYSCGPTVYNYAHIGNFRSFLTADLILRTARAIGWDVTYVSNITDVGHLTQDEVMDPSGEDRMAQALEREGERFANIYDLARFYTEAFVGDWKALNLLEPTVRPRATEHVTEQLKAVIRLVEKGHAYATDRGVYFSVDSFEEYGKLSGNTEKEQLQATDRDTVDDPDKRDPRDFALWKIDPDHLMQWHSPWGWGFPGWHIECSVMGMKYLGDRFDLHAGGEDLIFPHHECEIAQNESLADHDDPVCNHWVHTRFLQVEGEKMSKSAGNFYTVRDLIDPGDDTEHVPASIREQGGVDPLALRYALMRGQYRKPFNFKLETLRTAVRHVQRYQDAAERVDEALEGDGGNGQTGDADLEGDLAADLQASYDDTLAAMCDDLNTPAATAAALEGLKALEQALQQNGGLDAASARAAQEWLDGVNALLGIVDHEHDPTERTAASAAAREDGEGDGFETAVDELVAERTQAREAGDYDRADAIRDTLEAMGIELMDSPDGTEWRRKKTL